jgi:hypothetical protein
MLRYVDRARRVVSRRLVHERHQIGRRPRRPAGGHDLAPVPLPRAEQRLRPVPGVFELPPPLAARSRRAIGEAPFERLHAGLFIDRQDDAPRRRLQVQLGNRRHLLPKRGIGAVHPALDPMRLEIDVGQEALVAAPADVLDEAAARGFLDQLGDRARRLAARPITGSQARAINSKRVTGPNLGGGPGRGRSCNPASPWRWKRFRQRSTVRGCTPSHRAVATALMPSALARMMRARRASRWALVAARTRCPSGALLLVQRHPDARPPTTAHAATASWQWPAHQIFCLTSTRCASADFSGGISGSDH